MIREINVRFPLNFGNEYFTAEKGYSLDGDYGVAIWKFENTSSGRFSGFSMGLQQEREDGTRNVEVRKFTIKDMVVEDEDGNVLKIFSEYDDALYESCRLIEEEKERTAREESE